MNSVLSACLAAWLSGGVVLSGAVAARAGAIAPETPESRVETPVVQFTDDDDISWKPVEESNSYGSTLSDAPDRSPWRGERIDGSAVDNLLSAHQLFGPEIARQLDRDGRQSVEEILSLESLIPSSAGTGRSAAGGAPQGSGGSRLFDLANEILQPVNEGDGVISFSITGIGTFVVRRERETGDLYIRETSSNLSATVKRSALQDLENGGAAGSGPGELGTTLTYRQLAGKILDLLFGGPQLAILVLAFGLWITFKVWLKMRTRSNAG